MPDSPEHDLELAQGGGGQSFDFESITGLGFPNLLGDAADFIGGALTGDGTTTSTSEAVDPTAEGLILAVLSGNGLTPDFTNTRIQQALKDINELLALGQPVSAAVAYLNTFFAPDFEANALLVASSDGSLSLPTTDGAFASRQRGLTEEQVIKQFEQLAILEGFQVLVGPNGIRVVNPTGKIIAEFEQGDDGLYRPIIDSDAGGSGGGSGSAGQAARDARSIFEDNRDFGEDVFRDRRDTEESNRRFDLGFDEDITQNRLAEGRLNRADVGNLGVQLGELNLRMQDFVAQILREPADFLARAFSQRGGKSPFPEITQADLINQLRTEFQRIRDFTAEQLGLNSAQIADLTPPASGALEEVAVALAPEAALVTKEVETRGAVGGGAVGGTSGGGSLFPPLDDSEFDLGFVGNELGAPATKFIEPALDIDELGEQGLLTPSPEPTRISGLVDEEFEFVHGTKEENEPGKKGGADNELSLVGEAGPELLINHGDGSFDIVSNEDLFGLLDTKKKKAKSDEAVQSFLEGTLANLTADDLGRLSLFDVVDTTQTSQEELLSNAQLATPPGPAAVATGLEPPPLDVAGGSSFKLFSPQQFNALTPDEQVALKTRLASENRSLSDFLFASNRFFGGQARRRPRAVFDVTR